MRRLTLLFALMLGVLAAVPAVAQAGTTQPATRGFNDGGVVRYLDFGPIQLAPGNKVAPIWVFTNGTSRQANVIDVVPGEEGYTPLWKVRMVTWKAGVTPRTLRSAAAIRQAKEAGLLTIRKTKTVVNCPVLGFGQEEVAGFAKGGPVSYLDLGPVKLAEGNVVAPIWAFTNGTSDQRNVIDVLPGDDGYTPLWAVRMVTWRTGVTPRTLRSAAEIEAAMTAGDVTIEQTDIVVNCPVV
jgi:hypothetical protein